MARRPKSIADIDKEIEALKAQRVEALDAQAAHIGKLAAKADLTTLDIPDADLLKEFKAIAERFRGKGKASAAPAHRPQSQES